MNDFARKIKTSFQQGDALIKLIFINVGIFIIIRLLSVITTLFQINAGGLNLVNWFSIPSSLHILAIQPWTPFTYMFVHEAFMHIIFNMMWFYWFGQMFQKLYSQRQLVSLYILGGLAGAGLYILMYNLIPYFNNQVDGTYMLGASAAIMAIVVAVAATRPNDEINLLFLGSIKLKYIALFSVLIDILTLTSDQNSGGHLAHLGGALMGLIYVRTLQNSKGKTLSFITRIFDSVAGIFKPKRKIKVKYHRPGAIISDRNADYAYNAEQKEHQKQIDIILDKIKLSGYDSLTKEEKRKLFDSSKKI